MCIEGMRVLHIVPALFDSEGVIGGAERYVFELARHMAGQVPTRMLTFGSRNRSETAGALEIRVIGNPWYVRGQRNNPVSLAILREIARADVVHCHQQHVLASTIAAAACRLSNRRVFVTDLGGGGWDVSAYVATDRWYHGHLHVSEYSRKLYRHDGQSRARVILGGVDIGKFFPDHSIAREPTVLFVGRLLPHKGVNYLIEAMAGNCQLEIIGPPCDQRYLRDLRELANGRCVKFRHNCDDAALVEAYRRASCVVLPSVYKTMYGEETRTPELLGQTLLEAMACGTPVICTDVASMPEIVEDGVNGFIVAPNDILALREKIAWLLANPEHAAVMGKAGRRRVLDTFIWPAVVRRCLDAYAGSSAEGGHQQ
ncbi:MAG: glycosyltransferase family 4 protein [Candidatus Binataceae bacterium]